MKRIVGECNSLPFDIREASPVEDFKLEVCTFLTVWIFVYTFFDFLLCVCVYLLPPQGFGPEEAP